jgi:hypothetical protein
MPVYPATATRVLALVLVLGACSSSESAPSAPPPAPAPPPPPSGAPAPMAPAAPGAATNPLEALQALGAAAQQLAAAGQTTPGPVVNWRELAPFVPGELAGFKAKGEVDGSTTTMQGMQVSRVSRRYEQGKDRMQIELVDTSFAPFLRVPFAMAAAIQEDSSRGYKKGTSIKGQPAIVEWKQGGKSQAHLLAGQRFIVNIEVDTDTQGLAERVAESIDVAGIQALAARAQAQPGAPVAPPVAPAPPGAPAPGK